jgi:phage major head subunit gpT-like protein
MIINTANLASLQISYKAAFKNAFEQATPDWNKVATKIPSISESNLYAFLGQFPRLREWIGDRHVKNLAAHAYSLINKDFEATVAVPRNSIEDDQYGVFTPLMEEMGYAAKSHPDERVFAALAAGATDLCYDGQPFFDANHPVGASTQSNYDSTAVTNLWVLMDTRRPIKPLIWQMRKNYQFATFNRPTDEHVFMRKEYLYGVDGRMAAGYGPWQFAYGSLNTLNSTNVEAYIATMMATESDEGGKIGVKPNLIVCGPSNWAAARDLFTTQFLASGATNPNYQLVDVLVTPHLT